MKLVNYQNKKQFKISETKKKPIVEELLKPASYNSSTSKPSRTSRVNALNNIFTRLASPTSKNKTAITNINTTKSNRTRNVSQISTPIKTTPYQSGSPKSPADDNNLRKKNFLN
ncbi:hypothetical protein DICPUDRAFT_81548 [Dictyostelium purpureum]|uniref:Uncharacterized protein n=1 Tax=Dictyostelium purpureum TaxID=5786 RepID=F0ZTU2_DICPU|nr:uncharacterized protein DICPUDRAFT_81548 [Dictyostelium purpureum]EGC32634.1 hypothetical protein DICPUDRAFT_81548 [Dictyostelium purpureum]|eukprot:XP_003290849.1 hypothetical protein DICPUDRAFT_81548 [Dictyostelium purpureum]